MSFSQVVPSSSQAIRPPGRPRKIGLALTLEEPSQPKKRGRPRKQQVLEPQQSTSQAIDIPQSLSQSTTMKNLPGRPRKIFTQS